MNNISINKHSEVHWCQFDNPLLKSIPLDIWKKIFCELDGLSLAHLSLTCRTFRILSKYPPFQGIIPTSFLIGECEWITDCWGPIKVIDATREDILLDKNHRFARVIRTDNKVNNLLENCVYHAIPKRVHRLTAHLIYETDLFFCHRWDRPLTTLEPFSPKIALCTQKQMFINSGDEARLVWYNNFNRTIGVIQYMFKTVKDPISRFNPMWWVLKAGETLHSFLFPPEETIRDEGTEYKELWRIECGVLPGEATYCWSSNDHEIYCSTTHRVFRLIFVPAGIEECQIPPFKEPFKSIKAVGDRLFLLFENGELACSLRSPESPSCYILQWSQKVDNVCRIKDALIRKNILCIESDPTLVFLNIMTGEMIHKLPLEHVENWDFYGSYLVTFDSRYIHFYHLLTGAYSSLDIHKRLASKGCIKWAKIQQDDGTIYIDVEQLGIHKLYKLSPSQLK